MIDIYENDLSEKKRLTAIQKIEEITHQNVLMIHFWKKPFILYLRQRSLAAPKHLGTKRGIDIDLLWYDKKIAEKVKDYKKKGLSF